MSHVVTKNFTCIIPYFCNIIIQCTVEYHHQLLTDGWGIGNSKKIVNINIITLTKIVIFFNIV